MKKRIAAFLLCLALLLTACAGPASGASGGGNTVEEPLQEPTTELNVYLADLNYDYYLDRLIKKFEENHPDVALNVVSVEWGTEEEGQKLPAELAAGRGPDLYIGSGNEFKDFYKVLNTGTFCDLTPYLENMESFDRSNYVQNVIDGGIYRGKQCFMPLTWYYPGILTTQEALDDAGISQDELSTFSGLMRAAQRYSEANGGANAFFSKDWGGDFFYFANGLRMDYEALRADADTAEFKEMIDAYKLIYAQDWTGERYDGYTMHNSILSLRSRNHLFTNESSCLSIKTNPNYGTGCDFAILAETETPLLLPIPTVDGKTLASVYIYAAINANSKNKANAADFLELLLQKDMQDLVCRWSNPVYLGLFEDRINRLRHQVDVWSLLDESNTNVIGYSVDLSDEEADQLMGAMLNVDGVARTNYSALMMVFENMEPYFKDEQSYEACLRKLQSDLNIFISE